MENANSKEIQMLKCEQCDKQFSQRSSQNRHIKEQHLQAGFYKCKKCGLRFNRKYILQTHKKRAHSQDIRKVNKALKCYHCKPDGSDPQTIAEQVLQELKQLQREQQPENDDHIKSQGNLQIAASNSPEMFAIDSAMVKELIVKDKLYPLGHVTKHKVQIIKRSDGYSYYICEYCSKEFKKSYDYLRHRRIHTKVRPFICTLCKKSFPTSAQLNTHSLTHKLHEKFGIFKRFYKCPKCNEGFPSITQLDKHLIFHISKASLNVHKQRHDLFQKKFYCRMCHKNFYNNYQLQRHKLIHSIDKNYKCHYCDKTFKTSQNCRSHMITHLKKLIKTNEKTTADKKETLNKYTTVIEDFSKPEVFTTTTHIVRAVKFTPEKNVDNDRDNFKYKCLSCNKSFRYAAWLRKHFKYKHTNERPYECKDCLKKFRTKQILHTHLALHEASKAKVTCQVCGKQYASDKSLKIHLRIHTEERPFKCDNCHKEFRTSGHLIQHRKSNHKE